MAHSRDTGGLNKYEHSAVRTRCDIGEERLRGQISLLGSTGRTDSICISSEVS
jgi:hypothetical protein